MNADTGENFGAAIEATITLTVGAPKIGMLAQAAWPFVGRLEVAEDVGLVSCPVETELNWTQPEDFQNFPPRRAVAGHKGTFGHLAIVAGSFGFHGAAVLATRAAQRAQPGLVTLFAQEKIYPVVAPQLQAAMVNVWKPEMQFPKSTSAILIGCGLAAPDLPEEMKTFFTQTLERIGTAGHRGRERARLDSGGGIFQERHPRRHAASGRGGADVENDGAKSSGEPTAIVARNFKTIWKLLGRVERQPDFGWPRATGEIFVNPSGNPHLAQGGSGDVLAGFIAGLLAQPPLQADAAKTLRYAVWQHGNAADGLQAARANWVVEDLVEEIGNVR